MRECILTCGGFGDFRPMPGQYLKSKNGRTAYLILEVRYPKKPAKYVCKFVCERESPARLPRNAVVYPWQWSKR